MFQRSKDSTFIAQEEYIMESRLAIAETNNAFKMSLVI